MGSCKEKAVIRLPLERTDFFIWIAQKSENLKQRRDIGYIARYVIVKLELKFRDNTILINVPLCANLPCLLLDKESGTS